MHYNRIFGIGVLLNLIYVIIEASYGFLSGSLALIADAGHNLSDVLSLLIAWGAVFLANKSATEHKTYGFRKATIMASLFSSILLILALGGIAWESIQRLWQPQPIMATTVIIVASIGVIINTATALLFIKDRKHDLNIRAAFLHMAADAAISLGVVIAGILLLFTDWTWIDPLISLFIVASVLLGTWPLLRESINLSLDAVPPNIKLSKLKAYLSQLNGVRQYHDLHVWPLSTTEIALSVHLIVDQEQLSKDFLHHTQCQLEDNFSINHVTIQLENHDAPSCHLDRPMCC